MLKERLRWIYPMADSSSTHNKLKSSDRIIESSLFEIGHFNDVYVDIDNHWKTEEESRILRRELHTHFFLEDFAHAYLVTSDSKYIEYSFLLLEKWTRTFPYSKISEIDPLAYHDEGTAIRLLFWCKYYYKLFDFLSDYQKNYLNRIIKEQAMILTNDDFYSGVNNHGMFQDIGIIAYSMFNSKTFYEDDIFKKSLRRIYEYFNEVFTDEGVHKEHAPSYHILVLHNLKHVVLALRKAEYTDGYVKFLESVYNKGEKYILNVTMPNFRLPKISDSTDTNMTKTIRYRDLFDSDEYKFVVSGGELGSEPKSRIIPYPQSGYFIAREGWEKSSSYFLFLASYHMHYHKHTDDLSFILYKNYPIFIDSGPHSYNYKNEITRYGYSSFAHSTLILNNRSLPRTDYKFDDVYIKEHSVDNNIFSVTGVNDRFESASHERTVKGDLSNQTYNLLDKMTSNNKNEYKLLFQVSGDLDLYKHGNLISIFKKNSKIAEFEVNGTEGTRTLDVSVISGRKYPNLMGYEFPKKEEIQKSNVIVVTSYNNKAVSEVKSEIRLSNFKITGSATYADKYTEKNHGDINYIYINNGKGKLAVIFSATDIPYKYPTENRFDKLGLEYNLLIIKDNQFVAGSSFLKGQSSSTIESDITSVIFKYILEMGISKKDILFIGKSKAGFASLYFGLKLDIQNIYAISPLSQIGDYYSRHDKLTPVMKQLGGSNSEGSRQYLNNILFDFHLEEINSRVIIGVGELDYHYKKHIEPILEWFKANNFDYQLKVFDGVAFKDTDKEIESFIDNNILYKS